MIEDREALEEFGPYLVYERLGVGGMATVHRALERGIEGFERVVALKRLLPHLAEDASFIKSFIREAKLASLLQHANVCQILELGRVGPTYFISMEYIDGRDIRRVLRHARKVSGPPPINVTIGLMLQLCDALDYAHHRTDSEGQPLGLVHRDLSPSNLLVTKSGHLKVIDFGIAKAQSTHLRTMTGRVKGKLAYMAPEAIAGKELDARSDLFSVGVVFYELPTARPLFAQKNEYQTLLKVQRGEVGPPSQFNEGVPKELDDIVLKALAREPEDRWASAAALRDALVTVRMARQLSATPRDVSAWSDWAFSLDAPQEGFSGRTFTEGMPSGTGWGGASFGSKSPVRPPARPPSHHDEEAAIELAWGGPEAPEPIVHLLDEVPDVSRKIAPSAVAAAALDVDLGDAERYDPALMDPDGAQTQPDMPAAPGPGGSTIKTHAVPPPGVSERATRPAGRTAPRPAAFPVGSSDDALAALHMRPRSRTTGSHRTAGRATTSPLLAHARGSTTSMVDGADAVDADAAPTPILPQPSIGAAIAARETHRLRNTIVLGLVLAAAAAAAVVAIVMSHESAPTTAEQPVVKAQPGAPAAPVRTTGTAKFVTEPADAEITIAGLQPHHGSPWAIELLPGAHQIEIKRFGYKTWVTTIELSAGETQTLRVVLDAQEQGAVAASTATLIVAPSTPGMQVVLDDKVLDQRTPLELEVEPGKHVVALRQNGTEVWSEAFTAVANSTVAFEPSMSDEKKRERKTRRERGDRGPVPVVPERPNFVHATPAAPAAVPAAPGTPAAVPAARPGTATVAAATLPAAAASKPPTAAPTAKPPATVTAVKPPAATPAARPPTATPPPPAAATARPTPPPPPSPTATPAPVKPPPAPAAPRHAGVVPPSAVTKVAGHAPAFGATRGKADLPPILSMKVCIDAAGAVTSVSVLSKVPEDVKATVVAAVRGWKYTPYKQAGTAMSACLVASLRTK